MTLVKAHDGYGRTLYFMQEDWDNTSRRFIPLCTSAGRKLDNIPGKLKRGECTAALRQNICWHDPKTFLAMKIYQEDIPMPHCPICTPQLNKYNI